MSRASVRLVSFAEAAVREADIPGWEKNLSKVITRAVLLIELSVTMEIFYICAIQRSSP